MERHEILEQIKEIGEAWESGETRESGETPEINDTALNRQETVTREMTISLKNARADAAKKVGSTVRGMHKK